MKHGRNDAARYDKPQQVYYAEIALWIWSIWTCFYGIYETWREIPEIEQALDQLNGLISTAITISPDHLMELTIFCYGVLLVLSAWVVVKTGEGKHWARSSALWSFIIQAGSMPLAALLMPSSPAEYSADIPDFGLQIFALIMLYGDDSHRWFTVMAEQPNYKSSSSRR